jgi:FkbM family methyltransferase
MVNALKSLVEKAFRCRIYRRSLPRGTDLYTDIADAFGLRNIKVIFDVGANVGQSALDYARQFPNACIYSFEPLASTYAELERCVHGLKHIRVFRLGMGISPRQATLHVNADSKLNSLLHAPPNSTEAEVQIDSIEHFCAVNHIDVIDLLKIDTEGYELEVLEGARSLLERQRVSLVLAECQPIQHQDMPFVSFVELCDKLRENGYELFGVYNQEPYWDGRKGILYWNALFICGDLGGRDVTPLTYLSRRDAGAMRTAVNSR